MKIDLKYLVPIWYCTYNIEEKTMRKVIKLLPEKNLIDNSLNLPNVDSVISDNRDTFMNEITLVNIDLNGKNIPN